MRRYLAFLGPTLLVLIWTGVTWTHVVSPLLLPDPVDVVGALFRVFLSEREALPDLGYTIWRTAFSFAFSCAVGIPVGLAMGYVPAVHSSLEFIVDFFRSIPPIALFPLFLILLGLGEPSMLGVPIYGCTLVIIVNSAYGVSNVPALRRTMASVFGFSRTRVFTRIVFPDALPQVFTGMRTALSLALVLTVVVEMTIGAEHGIGKRIYDYHLLFRIPEMYGVIITSGIVGYCLNISFVWAEKRIVHWANK